MSKRLQLIRKELGMTQAELGQILGVGKSALSMIETGKASLSERNKMILIQRLNINPDWLETGEGEKFNENRMIGPGEEIDGKTMSGQSVPLYNINNNTGLEALFADKEAVKPVDYIHIPNLPRCDGAIYVIADGMYSLFNSGDIVLYKKLNDINNIYWGDMYLLAIDRNGEEFITVRYIQRSDREGYVKLVGQMPSHADNEIEIRLIKALAFVKASIRMNSMG